jgi:hypothetical protein
MCRAERRKHERLPLQLDVQCQQVGSGGANIYAGKTINVSTGGVFFHVADCKFGCDDLLNVELTVPPTAGLLELGGKLSTFARVIRVQKAMPDASPQFRHAVAAEFLECPKFI